MKLQNLILWNHRPGHRDPQKPLSPANPIFLETVLTKLDRDDIATIPAVLERLIREGDNATASPTLRNLFDLDMAATCRLLRVANSCDYVRNGQRHVNSISDAIERLGNRRTAEIAASITASKLFRQNPALGVYNATELWKHSVGVAIISRRIYGELFGPECPRTDPYLAGLLHDIGIAVEHGFFYNQGFAEAIKQQVANNSVLTDEEQKVLGLTHEDVGRAVGTHGHFSKDLTLLIGHHHHRCPEGCDLEFQRLFHVLKLADWLCSVLEFGYSDLGREKDDESTLRESLSFLDLSLEKIESLALAAQQELNQMERTGWFPVLRLRE